MKTISKVILLTLLLAGEALTQAPASPLTVQNVTFSPVRSPLKATTNGVEGMAINNSGVLLVDYISIADMDYHAARIYPTGEIKLPNFGSYCFYANLNNVKEYGGVAVVGGQMKGFFTRSNGQLFTYTVLGKAIQGQGAINDFEHKAFTVRDLRTNVFSGVLRDHMGRNTLLNYPGVTYTDAYGINNADEVVGSYFDGANSHGYLYAGGEFQQRDVPGASDTYPNGINNKGWIVGSFFGALDFTLHGYIYKDGAYTQVDYPKDGLLWTDVHGINDKGQFVGTALISNPALENGLERFAFTGTIQ